MSWVGIPFKPEYLTFRFITHLEQFLIVRWVSKVIAQLLSFCSATFYDYQKKLPPLSQPIRSETKTNRDLFAALFPALCTGFLSLLRVLISSFDCLPLLWLARVITLVLVLRHSVEKRCNIVVGNWYSEISLHNQFYLPRCDFSVDEQTLNQPEHVYIKKRQKP